MGARAAAEAREATCSSHRGREGGGVDGDGAASERGDEHRLSALTFSEKVERRWPDECIKKIEQFTGKAFLLAFLHVFKEYLLMKIKLRKTDN